MAKSKPNLRIGKRRVKGEPWVWLSGGAVVTGIVMIVGMLLLIVAEGMSTFWPHDIEAVVLGGPRFLVQGKQHGPVYVTRDDNTLVKVADDAFRDVDGGEFKGDVTKLHEATLLDYRQYRKLFDEAGTDWALRDASGNIVIAEGSRSNVTPVELLADTAHYLLQMTQDEREHYYRLKIETLTGDYKLNADEQDKLFSKLLILRPGRGQVYTDGNAICLKVGYKYLDGKPVELDFAAPRRATIADYREFRNLFKGDDWLLVDPNNNVVETDAGTPASAQQYIDNPDQFPSPWGYLDEQGKRVPIETMLGDDHWRDHVLLVGTLRGERDMDVREMPANPDGTPVKPYQLSTTPTELLIRQGNQGEDLYGRDAYFRWVRTNLPDVEAVRRQRESAYGETVLKRVPLPGAVLIERLEKGVLTGYVVAVTVGGKVIASIEKDGREKTLDVFYTEQSRMLGEYEQRYEIEKHDLGDVNFELKDREDNLKRIRYENRDSRGCVVALDSLEDKFKEWAGQEPLDRDYDTTEKYDVAREGWLGKFDGIMQEWKRTLNETELSDSDQQALDRALEVQTERATIQAEDFARLRYKVSAMRKSEGEATFTFETPNGQRTELVLAHVVRAFQPNEMGVFGKIGTYAGRIWEFLTGDPREANTEGGIWPVIVGTLVMTLLMCFAVVPFGVVAALYLREYAKQGPIVSAVRIAVNNLAGVPSIVFGIFGLGFFCVMMGGSIDDLFFPELQPAPVFGGGGIMWASLTLALLTVPVVIVSTEEALSAVPSSQREASLACGASKFQTVWKVVLPQALPGVLTGTILAMARGAGEVAPLMLVGAVKYAPYLPLDGTPPFVHLERKFMHLGFHIYDVGFQSPNVDNTKPLVFATALVLIIMVGALNVFAIRLRNRLRKKFATSHV